MQVQHFKIKSIPRRLAMPSPMAVIAEFAGDDHPGSGPTQLGVDH